jgi:tetratricopeptide (TPR) repeat protein
MKELANSPLELYEKAYRLHYDEGRIPEACRVYKAIVDEFPDSNECGYAVIQLEKILAQKVSERINISSRWVGVLAAISVVVSICCLAAAILISNMFAKTVHAGLSSASIVSQALGKMSVGKDKQALDLLDDAKSAAQNKDAAPYLLSADIYLKKQQYAKALAEYEALRKVAGYEAIAKEEMVKAKAEEENATRRPAVAERTMEDTQAVQKSVEPPAAEIPKPEPPAPVVREVRQKVKKESASPARPAKQKKAGGLSHSDSVSFF